MRPPQPLTPIKRRVLDAIRLIAGIAPSLDEIAARVGLRAKSAVSRHLDALEAAGHIERGIGRRNIRLCGDQYVENLAEAIDGWLGDVTSIHLSTGEKAELVQFLKSRI